MSSRPSLFISAANIAGTTVAGAGRASIGAATPGVADLVGVVAPVGAAGIIAADM
jgi:hypothetical protein